MIAGLLTAADAEFAMHTKMHAAFIILDFLRAKLDSFKLVLDIRCTSSGDLFHIMPKFEGKVVTARYIMRILSTSAVAVGCFVGFRSLLCNESR